MRNFFLTLLLLVSTGFAAEFTADQNTIALWHFNEGAGSSFSNVEGGSGTLYGSPIWITGRFGSAVQFDGISTYGNCNIAPPISNCTYEIWANPDSNNSGSWIIMTLGIWNAGIVISHDTVSLCEFPAAPGQNSVWIASPNVWHYFALVISSDSAKQAFYIDGMKTANVIFTRSTPPVWNSLWLGVNRTNGYSGYFKGCIDEFRISNISRTEAEISGYWDSNVVIDHRVPVLIPYEPKITQVKRPLLQWHGVSGASAYTITADSSPNFLTTVFSLNVSDTFFQVLSDLPYGNIYWKVKSNLVNTWSAID